MEKILRIEVWFLDDQYHGVGDWPPAPARFFQALIAGNAIGAHLPDECANALGWLECLHSPPEINAQPGRLGLSYTTFVPNNDLDAKGGDPHEVASVRVAKTIHVRHIDASIPVIYSWCFDASEDNVKAARQICAMADNIHRLGRGLDMAWARADVVDSDTCISTQESFEGNTFRPGNGRGEIDLDCPIPGSLNSLLARYGAHRQRLGSVTQGKRLMVYFTNPPKPYFHRVSYNPTSRWCLFELHANRESLPFRAWPQYRVANLVEQARDGAGSRLITAMPGQADLVERFLIGRDAGAQDKARRVRIIPIPSIGMPWEIKRLARLMIALRLSGIPAIL